MGLAHWFPVKVAVPVWKDRISPVFDVARRLVIAEIRDGAEVAREQRSVDMAGMAERAACLGQAGVDVLICGAISRPLAAMLAGAGIQVIAQTCGPADDVLRAFAAGQLGTAGFMMPGCRGWRRRRGGRGGQERRQGMQGTFT